MELFDALIRRKSTGPPRELAEKLDISERWLYKLLSELKEELNCPIVYDRYEQSYVYEEYGKMGLGFQTELSEKEKEHVTGGIIHRKFDLLYLFVQ